VLQLEKRTTALFRERHFLGSSLFARSTSLHHTPGLGRFARRCCVRRIGRASVFNKQFISVLPDTKQAGARPRLLHVAPDFGSRNFCRLRAFLLSLAGSGTFSVGSTDVLGEQMPSLIS
jgi:hypothetical protein